MSIPVLEKENTIRIKSTITDDQDKVVEPDNKNAFIKIIDLSKDETVLSKTTMTEVSDTQFQYDWNTTSGTAKGEYIAQVTASVSSDTISNKQRFRLDDII